MGRVVPGLVHGMVVETDVKCYTAKYLYSDYATGKGEKDSVLNKWAKIPVAGIFAGISRMVLGILHSIGHLFSALFTQKKGHLFHAAKGGCEVIRGLIESLPVAGRIFANLYNRKPLYDPHDIGGRSWWMMKIYNPKNPDGLDKWMDNWKNIPSCYYIKA